MADDDLRELERTWRASGVLEDGVTWHRARLRSGAIDRDGLRREGAAGDRAAQIAADDLPPGVTRLDAWLRANAPEVLASFGAPATEAELEAAEATLGGPLPPVLRSVYCWRNGQALGTPPDHTFPDLWRFLTLEEVGSVELRPRNGEYGWPAGSVPFMQRLLPDLPNLELIPPFDSPLRVLAPAAEVWRAVPETPELRANPPSVWPAVQEAEGHLVMQGSWEVRHQVVAGSLEGWLNLVVAALEQGVWSFGQHDQVPFEYFSRAIAPGYPQSYLAAQQIFASDLPSLDPILLDRRRATGCELAFLPGCFTTLCLLAATLFWGSWLGTVCLVLAGLSVAGALALVLRSRSSRARAEARGEALTEAFADASLPLEDEA